MADPEDDRYADRMTLLLRDITQKEATYIVEAGATFGRDAEEDAEDKLFERFLAEVNLAIAEGRVPTEADIWINYFADQITFTIPLALVKLAAEKDWKINVEAND